MKLLLLFILSIFSSIAVSSKEGCSDKYSLYTIISEYNDSIENIEEQKIYLKADHIYQDEQGFWIENAFRDFRIQSLRVDNAGYFLSYNNVNEIMPFYKCSDSNCGSVWLWIEHPSSNCPRCNSPGTPIGY